MDCRIEVVKEHGQRLVRLAGRLAEAQVPDLLDVCSDNSVTLRLRLGDLISVDAVGLETLHRLRERGATLTEVPAYIQLKLDGLRTARARAR